WWNSLGRRSLLHRPVHPQCQRVSPRVPQFLGRPVFVAPECESRAQRERRLQKPRRPPVWPARVTGREAGPTKTTPNLKLSSGLPIESRNLFAIFSRSNSAPMRTPHMPPLLVPQARLERARPREHQILSLARLPVPPLGLAGRHHSGGGLGVNAGAGANKAVRGAAFPDPTAVLRSA